MHRRKIENLIAKNLFLPDNFISLYLHIFFIAHEHYIRKDDKNNVHKDGLMAVAKNTNYYVVVMVGLGWCGGWVVYLKIYIYLD